MSTDNEDIDLITSDETEETSENESQETLEPEFQEEDDGLTPAARNFKEKRREENARAREALSEVPKLKAQLEKHIFYKSNPNAEDYEVETDEFLVNNPTVSREKAYKYVLAELNPALLTELSDQGAANQAKQSRTSMNSGEKSFSEQVNGTTPTTIDDMKAAALKEAKDFVF